MKEKEPRLGFDKFRNSQLVNLSFIVARMIFTPDQRISMNILKGTESTISHCENELDASRFISTSNRNDWSMDPNRLDPDISQLSAATSVIIQNQNEISQEIRLESLKIMNLTGF